MSTSNVRKLIKFFSEAPKNVTDMTQPPGRLNHGNRPSEDDVSSPEERNKAPLPIPPPIKPGDLPLLLTKISSPVSIDNFCDSMTRKVPPSECDNGNMYPLAGDTHLSHAGSDLDRESNLPVSDGKEIVYNDITGRSTTDVVQDEFDNLPCGVTCDQPVSGENSTREICDSPTTLFSTSVCGTDEQQDNILRRDSVENVSVVSVSSVSDDFILIFLFISSAS